MPADSAIRAICRAFCVGDPNQCEFQSHGYIDCSDHRIRESARLIFHLAIKRSHQALHFLTGHPILMSMICAPLSTLNLAHSANICGSAPAICTAFGFHLTFCDWYGVKTFSVSHNLDSTPPFQIRHNPHQVLCTIGGMAYRSHQPSAQRKYYS